MKKIKINEINKIEGHMSFQAALDKGNVKEAKVTVEEGARLIEGILIGRNYSEAPIITARICGICPVVHNLTSIKALESALGVNASQMAEELRKIMLSAQIIQSHSLHLYFCSLPDFFKLSDNFKLLKKFPKQGKEAIIIRDFANRVVELIGGRAIHPINSVVGGFNVLPTARDLLDLEKEAKEIIKTAIKLAEFFEKLKYPRFSRETEYLSLDNSEEYSFYEGMLNFKLAGKSKEKVFVKDFFEHIKEIESGNVEKRTEHNGKSYMIGALARINNNHKKLQPKAKMIFNRNKKQLLNYNTFYNILAQAIEVVHFAEIISKELKKVIPASNKNFADIKKIMPRKGTGAAICEAPRGILYHQYELNEKGKIINCNIITPTAQFLNNMEDDLKVYLKGKKDISNDKIKFLIRAYDPCISCATH